VERNEGPGPGRRRLQIDASYREEVTLRDGRRAVLRLLRPEDRDLLQAGFRRLSPRSRQLRFHVPKAQLTRAELDYLTNIDQQTHVAIGAVSEGPGSAVGLGVARFVRLEGEDATAEAAITVADEAQGVGLGSQLLGRLARAARERGVRRFRCEVLSANTAMQALLRALAPGALIRDEGGGVLVFEFDLEEAALYGLLRLAAREFAAAGSAG
jgi:ribosomal protein S18 acetylase RimI-like enzyme